MRALAFALLVLASPAVLAAMQSKPLEWELDGTQFSGVIVYDDAGPERPGLLMVPNWMGVNDDAVAHARDIAGDRYVVLVADVYGKSVRPANPAEAGAATNEANSDPARLRARTAKALDVLRSNASRAPLDGTRIAAIGFCFGGSTALELARSGANIAGVVSFHGGLATTLPATRESLKASVLVLNGAEDANIPQTQIDAFEQEMRAIDADWQFVNFGGAVHCFSEPSANRPPNCVYHERSAKRANRMMESFLAERFGAE